MAGKTAYLEIVLPARFKLSMNILHQSNVFCRTVFIWSVLSIWALSAYGQQGGKTVYQDRYLLGANERIERKIKPDEVHLYTVDLKTGEMVHIKIEQLGINVIAAIGKDDAEHKVLKQTDNAEMTGGTEDFLFMAASDGKYLFGVFAKDAASLGGSYRLQNTAPFATAEEKTAAAAELDGEAKTAYNAKNYDLAIMYHQRVVELLGELPPSVKQGLAYFALGNDLFNAEKYSEAIKTYRKAVPIFHKFDDFSNEGLTLFNIGGCLQNSNDFENAARAYQEAVPPLARAGNDADRAQALYFIGGIYKRAKDYERSNGYLEQALPVFERLKTNPELAHLYVNLGENFYSLGLWEKTAEYFKHASDVFGQVNDVTNRAITLSNLGLIYAKLERADLAVIYLNQTLAILPEIKDPEIEARTYLVLGDTFLQISRNEDALKQFEHSLTASRKGSDRLLDAAALRGIGMSNSELGKYEAALDYHARSLKIAVDLKDESEQAAQYTNIGLTYMEMGKYDLTFENNDRAMAIYERQQDKMGMRTILNNKGVAFLRLGSLNKAESCIRQSSLISRQLNDRRSIALTISNLGAVYARLKQYDKAIALFDEALPLLAEFKENRFIVTTEYYYGTVRRERGELDKAVKLHQDAIDLARRGHMPKFEARSRIELGLDRLALNLAPGAAAEFQTALVIAREVKARDEEAAALNGLMQAAHRLNQADLAIFYGKQSINLLQAIRGEIVKFTKDVQADYVKDNEKTYRQLAETLVAEGRLPEAQQVLGMLKEEELSGFVRRDAKEIETLSKRSDLRANERLALEKYNLFSSKVTALGAEMSTLEERRRTLPPEAAFPEQPRLDEVTAQVRDANAAFRLFLEKELAAELGKEKKHEVEADRALQGKLRQWGPGTVAISTIVGENRYRVILTTPTTQIDGKTEIKAAELNQKIFAFRNALLNPSVDPRPLGKEIYDVLVKPIEKDLAAANAKTLLWSLDGTLRYIPISALWDGSKYLIQKYENVLITSTTRQSLLADVNKDWRILGAGVSKASQVTDANTDQKFSFGELKGVENELSAVIGKGKAIGGSQGVSLIDAAFTSDALKHILTETVADKRKYNVIHFATHFRLGTDSTDSFLLLGNNKALTLADVADSPELNFTDVELVTLSACNTGFGGIESNQSLTENNGKEVDSLAQFIELRGAKSVMATLWAVVDPSTALLMGEFYRLRKMNPGWSKAETLRRSQLELLSGNAKSDSNDGRRSDPIAIDDTPSRQPPFIKDPAKPFAHPHYWAPFVLIGNWR